MEVDFSGREVYIYCTGSGEKDGTFCVHLCNYGDMLCKYHSHTRGKTGIILSKNIVIMHPRFVYMSYGCRSAIQSKLKC